MAYLLSVDGGRKEILPEGRFFRLDELQGAVGGLIALYGLHDGKVLVCNDDGLSLSLPLNPEATDYYNTGRDTAGWGIAPVTGDVVICSPWEVE